MRNNLEYKNGVLHLDGVNLRDIAAEYGTPVYVYSADKIRENFESYTRAFDFTDTIICYAVKANYNGAIIKLLSSLGAGADVVSAGELYMALRSGMDPGKIVFAGVGKTRQEIREAVKQGICLINIESSQELDVVQEVASQESRTADISFRINPDIDPKTHPKISTGLKENKFGIQADEAFELYRKAESMKNVRIKGIHLHIGSQITDVEPFRLAAQYAVSFADRLADAGIDIKCIDIGGGLGINYKNKPVPMPGDIAGGLKEYFRGRSQTLILEPGRSLVGNAGYLLTEINYIKRGENKNFVVVDAGFNDLARPALYGAYHEIVPVSDSPETITADVVGPICESGDFIALKREIKAAERGNILAVCDSGAYGFSMSSNYNSRPRSAEIIVENGKARVIRRRETVDDLVDTEQT